MKDITQKIRSLLDRLAVYGVAGAKWLILSVTVGVICGLVGSGFHIAVELVTEFRLGHRWVIFLLPAAGLLAVFIYDRLGTESMNTDTVLREIQSGEGISVKLLPAIFLTTVLTHLAGGSAGREGAALQMGGTLGYSAGRLMKLDDRGRRTATMIGMAAFFSALFGTPVAAAVFTLEVVSVDLVYHGALLPCLISTLTSFGVSLLLGVEPTGFDVTMPEMTAFTVVKVAVLALICGLAAMLFCETLHLSEKAFHRYLKNKWVRAAAGGAILLGLTLLLGTSDYNGAGMGVIARAVENGQAEPAAFFWKLIFTAVTLSVGFKGGEVVPSFFIGATFACVVGPMLGIPAGFAASVGLIAVFCGAVNCPIASSVLAVEMFGGEGLLFYALACAVSFVFSGSLSIYSSQRAVYDRLKHQLIDRHTNGYFQSELSDK